MTRRDLKPARGRRSSIEEALRQPCRAPHHEQHVGSGGEIYDELEHSQAECAEDVREVLPYELAPWDLVERRAPEREPEDPRVLAEAKRVAERTLALYEAQLSEAARA